MAKIRVDKAVQRASCSQPQRLPFGRSRSVADAISLVHRASRRDGARPPDEELMARRKPVWAQIAPLPKGALVAAARAYEAAGVERTYPVGA